MFSSVASSIAQFFDSEDFMPHGMCLLWRPEILWTHVVADAFIALAYFSIPAALVYFAAHRRTLPHVWILYMFGAFIVWCGITHVASIWTFWVPAYGVQAVAKVVTALVSVVTAVMLWPLMPRALRIPGIGDLQAKNAELQNEIAERIAVERRLHELTVSLERRVEERTRELRDANTHLEEEIERRRQSEILLRKAKGEAETANSAKSVFLAGMGHELRSPLNAIMGFAQLIEQVFPGGLDPRQRDYLKNIEQSGAHLLEMIERLLDLSMAERGHLDIKFESTDVAACLDRARAILEPMAEQSGVTLSIEPAPGDSEVIADPTRLSQVLVNLGSNAIKYNRRGGRVDISINLEGEDTLVVEFIDTGIGIPSGVSELVFQPFARVNRHRTTVPGAGIGLPLSRRLAHAMGAELSFESAVGVGSTFRLELQRVRHIAGAESQPVLPSCRVLYLDNDPHGRGLIDLYARLRPELQVLHAASIEEISRVTATAQPDLVIVDVDLWAGAEETWRAALDRCTGQGRARVVGVVSDAEARTGRRTPVAPVDIIITKPILFRELADTIARAMAS